MVRWLVESETVHREDKELYEYAVYSLFLTVTPIVLILIIGSLLGKTIQGLIIIFPFMFIGGIHAKKLRTCLLSSCVVLFLVVWLVDKLNNNIFLSISVFSAAFSLICFSPIDSENRRLSVDERKEYKITTISMTTIFVAIYGVLLYAEFRIYAICIAEGIILTAMLQIPCIVVKLWRVCREEKDQKNVNIVVSSKSD